MDDLVDIVRLLITRKQELLIAREENNFISNLKKIRFGVC